MKKHPYIVEIEWTKTATVISFGKNKEDAIANIDLDCDDFSYEEPGIEFYARKINSIKEIPKDILEEAKDVQNSSFIFGLEDGESIEEYFSEEKKKELAKELDKKHYHFDFWDKVQKSSV